MLQSVSNDNNFILPIGAHIQFDSKSFKMGTVKILVSREKNSFKIWQYCQLDADPEVSQLLNLILNL